VSVQHLLTRPCTIRYWAPGPPDTHNDPTDSWSEVDTVCTFQMRGRQESADQGELSITTWMVTFSPNEVRPRAADALVVENETYQFRGDAWPAHDLRGQLHHYEATVNRAEAQDPEAAPLLTVTAVNPATIPLAGGTLTITGTALTSTEAQGAGTAQVYFHDITHGSYYYATSYSITSDNQMTATWDWSAPQSGPLPSDVGDTMNLTASSRQAQPGYTFTYPNVVTVAN